MALNVISNFAANVAHRNLTMSDAAATSSLAKLSSGSRVVSAKDDAASLAIGSRLRAEVVAMRTASVNAGQAGSMLQIADGALATVSDMLVRMKELAVQASSGQFSSVERGVLDSEYQALLSEITRISDDTEFNGTQLIAGGASTVTNQFLSDFTKAGNGFSIEIDPAKVADNSAFRLSFDTVTAVAQVDDVTIAIGGGVLAGEVFTIKVVDNNVGKTFTANYTVLADAETAETIEAGLIAAVNNIVGVTVTASNGGAGVVSLTANTAGNSFTTTTSETSAAGSLALANGTANVIGGDFLTLTNLTTADETTVDVAPVIDAVVATAGDNLAGSETAKVLFDSLGVTVTLDANFDRKTDHITTGTVTDAGANLTAETVVNDTDGGISNDALTALLALGSSVYDSDTGILTVALTDGGATLVVGTAGDGLKYQKDGAGGFTTTQADLVGSTSLQIAVTTANGIDVEIANVSFTAAASTLTSTLTIDVGDLVFGSDVAAGSSTQSFTFKVGTGNQTYDNLTFSVNASSAAALGLNSTAITTAALAESASSAVSSAIDTLNQTRSDIGAAQNRLTFASNNLATAIENAEAARSNLLDLDVAQEISVFTSKQILVQTGVAMLAQANQLPQNLLRLFQ
jgi:flagellin